MAEKGVIFDRASGEKVATATKRVLAQPTNNAGSPFPNSGVPLVSPVTVTAVHDPMYGVYLGYWRRAVIQKFDVTRTGTLNGDSINDFGEVPTDQQEIYIQNMAEEGTETHALMDPDADVSRTHLGFLLNMPATDGKPVYVINGSTGIAGCT